jgi:hypothetical protein
MTRFSSLVVGALILLRGAVAFGEEPYQAEPPSRATPSAAVERRPAIALIAPTADMAIGHYTLFSTQLGGSVMVSILPSLRLGLAGAISGNVTNGMEGCSTTETCIRSWKRATVSVEYHHFPRKSVDFWWGMQAGAEWRQADTQQVDSQNEHEKRTFALIQPNAGVDFVAAPGHGIVGLGIYAGVPLSLDTNDTSIGGLLGIRGLFGVN